MKLQRGVQFFGSITILLTAGAMDRFLKMAVELERFKQAPIGWRYFAFEQFHNTGVAFSIPIPLWFVLPLTVVFLIALLMWAQKKSHATLFACSLIAVGALSNAFDRILYGYTIDYLRILNAVINLADVWVIVGTYTLFFNQKNQR